MYLRICVSMSMSVRMSVCMSVCMFVCLSICIYMYPCRYICMYVGMYVGMYVRYVCNVSASRLTVDFQGNHTAAAVFSALWFHVWLQMLPVVPTVKPSGLSQNLQRIIYVVKQLHAKQLQKHATRKATWL